MSPQAVNIRVGSSIRSVQAGRVTPPDPSDQDGPSPQELRMTQMEQELQQALQGLRQTQAALEQGVAKVLAMHEQYRTAAHNQLADMAVQVAAKVLMQEIKAQRHEVDPIVQAALLRVPARQDVTIRLNGDDLARCRMADQGPSATAASTMRFVADSSVAPGDCIVECAQGIVESNIESQLAEVAAALKDRG